MAIPSVIHICDRYNLYDEKDFYRKDHAGQISRLGGVAIFCGFMITLLMFATLLNTTTPNFLIIACLILFGVGLKDDIYGVNVSTKFGLQAIVALILVTFGGYRLSSMYGVFGITDMNPFWGSIFTIAVIIFINNAFNLIDGIDGLSSTIGIIVNLTFGIAFIRSSDYPSAFVAFSMVGAISGFLVYNHAPAKIFMGDTGALILGLVSVVLAIHFIEINRFNYVSNPDFTAGPAIAVAILIVPVFDSLRIFTIRILHGVSPFVGDNNHIHHRLKQHGLSTNQTVLLLALFNLLMIVFAVYMQSLGNFGLISVMITICVLFNVLLTYRKGRKKRDDYKVSDVLFKDTLKFRKGVL
ncbi:MAG: undecaprenyl/decaprenyl-phosphate alpha-N-acetylglucosaminyl 1-phosphate transferase [Pedobacter sp.]|nr:MAG: undecaprenyl/decaprenyl-phosphate alpha-N-acetylglucosaminyl 1-phosphate transferase [Pedobacter sp.]